MSADQGKKSGSELELLANLVESIEAGVVDGRPPTDTPSGEVVPADERWIPVGVALPNSDKPMEVWNTARDTIEAALYDAESGLWYSLKSGFPYLFGAVTHWRMPRLKEGSGVPK